MSFDLAELIRTVGYLGLFLIIFSESGFFGFMFPGDSLLFTAGFLASQNILDFPIVLVVCFLGAVLGDSTGYYIGKFVGTKFLFKDHSRVFKKKYLDQTHAFYERHGGKAIIIARFVPVVRTFVPLVAGVAKMNYGKFFMFNVIGGVLWAIGLTSLGYTLGKSVPGVEKFIEPAIILIIIISLLPAIWHVLKEKESRESIRKATVDFVRALPFVGPKRKS